MRFIRAILFLPILVLVSPALLLLGFIILIMENGKGTLRSLCAMEIRTRGFGSGVRRFMETIFVPNYRNHIQSFVLGAAGFLVVAVGLRGMGVVPVSFVYAALAVEFTLLTVWAVTLYFTVEDTKHVESIVTPPLRSEKTQELVDGMKELSTHIAFLERRLAVTEVKFEHLGKLDSSMQTLSTRLNLLVSDQLNLRVKREFDQILTDLVQRASAAYTGRDENRPQGNELA